MKLNGRILNNLKFADDTWSPLTRSRAELKDINFTTQIDETSRNFCLMMNTENAETIVVEKSKDTPITLTIQGETTEQFAYLGGLIIAAVKRHSQEIGTPHKPLENGLRYMQDSKERKTALDRKQK